VELQNIDFTEGQNNTPGIDSLMFLAYEDIAILPELINSKPETAGSVDDFVTVSGHIYMKQNKKAIDFYFTDQTADYKYVLQGSDDSKGFKNSIVMSTPNKASGFASFLANVKNRRGIMLARTKGGDVIMLGGPRIPVRLESTDGMIGSKATDASQGTLTFYCNDTVPMRYFTGKVYTGTGGSGGSGSGATEQVLFAN
jgi:hypothetical protein